MIVLKHIFRIRPIALLALALTSLAVVTAVACGGDDDDASKATQPAATSAASPTTAPKAAYPVQVTDLLNRTVEIKAKPTTVVAISPTAAELVYAAGGTIVGRSSTVAYPPEAKAAKDVGSAYKPSVETILALKPDLVVADSIVQAQLKSQLEGLGIPVVFAGADSYQKVIDSMTLMGKVFDSQAATAKLIADINKARDDAKAALAGKKISAIALIADQNNTLYAAKPNSYPGDIMNLLGLTNPAAGQPDAGNFPGYTAVPQEKMLEYNPDYIFTITPAPQPVPRLSTIIPTIPPFQGLKAVTAKHVVELDDTIFLQAPGPRIGEAFKAIAKAAAATP